MKELIGKRIRVRINDRDDKGQTIANKFCFIFGTCTFAGYNKSLDVWQVTVDRMPIFPIQFKDVKLLDV
jgi:hypothetical protein